MRRTIDIFAWGIALAWAFAPAPVSAGAALSPAAGSHCGLSAWYEHTTPTAGGEMADPAGLAAAHRTLPFGTMVHVENLDNGRSVEVARSVAGASST